MNTVTHASCVLKCYCIQIQTTKVYIRNPKAYICMYSRISVISGVYEIWAYSITAQRFVSIQTDNNNNNNNIGTKRHQNNMDVAGILPSF